VIRGLLSRGTKDFPRAEVRPSEGNICTEGTITSVFPTPSVITDLSPFGSNFIVETTFMYRGSREIWALCPRQRASSSYYTRVRMLGILILTSAAALPASVNIEFLGATIFSISSIPSVITHLFKAWSSIGIESTVAKQSNINDCPVNS
jgi:hypothetical protein